MTEASAAATARELWVRPAKWAQWEVIALAALVLLGLVLRLRGYAATPAPSDNQDELAWAWSGLTLITRHVPYAWSYLSAYHDASVLYANGTTYPIVHPWLDDPPLFSALVGGVAWMQGARDLTDVTVQMIRPVPIALSTISIALIHGLGRRVLPREAAIVGAALMATAPAAVLFGRVVESENLLAPLLLAALILAHRLLTGEGRRPAIAGLLLCCTAASLTKVPGLAVAVASGVLLLTGGRWRIGSAAFAAGLAGLLLYSAYGAAQDWHTFMNVIASHADKRHGLLSAYEFIAAPAGNGLSIRDGWWLLGWIGLGAMLARPSLGVRLIPLAALVFATGILLLADQTVVPKFGWYRVAIYPLIYAGAGYLCWEAVRRANVVAFLVVLALGGASAASFALGPAESGWVPSALWLSVALLLVLTPSVLVAMGNMGSWSKRVLPVAQATTAATVVVILAMNVAESLRLDQVYLRL